MKRFFRFFLFGALFELRSFTAQAQFYHIILHTRWQVFGAKLNDALHVAALASYQASGDLKFLIVLNLDFESASVLDSFHLVAVILVLLLLLLMRLLLMNNAV